MQCAILFKTTAEHKSQPQSKLKVKGGVIAYNNSPFQSYGASPAVWDPTVLPATLLKCIKYYENINRKLATGKQ